MAIAHVQTVFASSGGGGITSISATLTTTAHNAVIVTVMSYFQATSFTQTAGDSLTQEVYALSGGLLSVQYDNLNVAGGSTTYTFSLDSASTSAAIFVTEVSGLATNSAFDKSADGSPHATATTHSSGTTATTTQADEICVAVCNYDGAGATSGLSVSNSFTIPTNGNQTGAGVNMRGALAYKIVSATGAYETTFTTNDSIDGMAIIGTYKAPVAGPTSAQLLPAYRQQVDSWYTEHV